MSDGGRQVILMSWMIDVAEGSTVCSLGFIISRGLVLRTGVFNTDCFLIFKPPEEIFLKNVFSSSYYLNNGLIIWVRLGPSPFQRFLSLTAVDLTMGSLGNSLEVQVRTLHSHCRGCGLDP